MSYEVALVTFWCENALCGKYAQILRQPRKIMCLIPNHNHVLIFTPDRITNNNKYSNIKSFSNTFDIYWKCILFELHKISLVERSLVIISSAKDYWNYSQHTNVFLWDTLLYYISQYWGLCKGSRINGFNLLRVLNTLKYFTWLTLKYTRMFPNSYLR